MSMCAHSCPVCKQTFAILTSRPIIKHLHAKHITLGWAPWMTRKTGQHPRGLLQDRIPIPRDWFIELSAKGSRAVNCSSHSVLRSGSSTFIKFILTTEMAMTSVASRAQILPATTSAAVRPSRRVVQVIAKQNMSQKVAARSGVAAAAAAILLTVRPSNRQTACMLYTALCVLARSVCLLVLTGFCFKVDLLCFWCSAGQPSACADVFPSGTNHRLHNINLATSSLTY